MTYSEIKRTANIEINGEQYELRFTLAGLEQLESRMTGSLFDSVSSGGVPKLTTLVDTFWIGFSGAGRQMKRDDAAALAASYMRENGMDAAVTLFYTLLALSGILGKAASANMLASFNGGETDAKNVKTGAAKASKA